MAYKTHVGSLDAYQKGTIELADDLRKYAFSNVYEVAGKSAPFERVAVVQNLEYVAEVVRVEGESPWYAAPHDEFAIVMDGEVVFRFVKLEDDQVFAHQQRTRRSPGAIPRRKADTPGCRYQHQPDIYITSVCLMEHDENAARW